MILDRAKAPQIAGGLVSTSAMVLMGVALVFGGASRNAPLPWMGVEIVGLVVFLLAAWRAAVLQQGRSTYAAYAILLLAGLIPLLQLIPLPPDIWKALPGREPLSRAIELTGLANAWRPISLAPDETQRALLYLLAPAGMFLAVVQCDERQRARIALVAIAVGLSSLAVGLVQVLGGAGAAQFYPEAVQTLPNGFFANRNHQAVFLVSDMALVAIFPCLAMLPAGVRSNPMSAFGLMFLFAVGAAATLSRAGILLLFPVALGAGVIYVAQTRARMRWTALIAFVTATSAALALVFALKGGPIWDRFLQGDVGDVRFADYPQIARMGMAYQPFGSGVGSFDLIYRAQERLDQLDPFYLNHAHNDFLEAWLEAGWPGLILIVLFMAWWIWSARAAWSVRRPNLEQVLARSSTVVIGALLLHSLVDYPLRTPALAVFLAFNCGLLCNVWPSAASLSDAGAHPAASSATRQRVRRRKSSPVTPPG